MLTLFISQEEYNYLKYRGTMTIEKMLTPRTHNKMLFNHLYPDKPTYRKKIMIMKDDNSKGKIIAELISAKRFSVQSEPYWTKPIKHSGYIAFKVELLKEVEIDPKSNHINLELPF